MANAYSFDGKRFTALDWQPRYALRWTSWRPDGAVALSVGNGGSALLFDGRKLDFLSTGSRQNLRGAAWSPDGRTALMVGNRGAVFSLQGESIAEVPSSITENLRRVAWHPGGGYALIVGNAGTVLRYDHATAALMPLPGDRAHTLRSLAFRPDGAYALIGAYASRWAGYPRPHPLYRCDGRHFQALLASDDEDDLVAVDWSISGKALVCGYAWRADGSLVNKAIFFDQAGWQTTAWPAKSVILGAGWQPRAEEALLVGEDGLALKLDDKGGIEQLDSGTNDNLIGPFWRPDGSDAIILKGPGDKVYTV
ncbi:MAG TPA: WD40 repeat domain-containing protein [Dehalococcoidia bacterium]|nr:WD40 repeat domain-containing protein [Dehalococcoidia bacterium]